MKTRSILAVISIVIFTACSKTPSDSDGKEVVVKMLDGCNRISLENFEKTNGVANGENGYQLSIKFSLKIIPPENSATLQNIFTKEINGITQKIQQAQQEADIATAEAGNYTRGDLAGHDDISVRREKADQLTGKMFKAQSSVLSLQDYKRMISDEPAINFQTTCAKTDNSIFAGISAASAKFEAAHPEKNAYLSGFTVNLTGIVNLVKTDNGWKQGL